VRFPSSLLGLRYDDRGRERGEEIERVVGWPILVVLFVIAKIVSVVV